jgi:hypothetical protein
MIEMARRIFIVAVSLIVLVFIWPVNDGFPVAVSVDGSINLGNLPEVLRPGLYGDWSANSEPISSQFAFDKKPFWRLSLGIGWDESLNKPADFDISFRDWLRDNVDPNIKKYQDAGYQTVISLIQVPKWLSSHPDDGCMPSSAECWKKWQYSPPGDYVEWKRLLQLLVTTQKQDGIKADYIIWDEPNWMFYGTEEQYFEMYKHSAEAIKGIDSSIKVGALGVGCWACGKESNCPAEFTGLPDGQCPNLGHSMIMGQIMYVSGNNIPMDFIDWHFPELESFTQQVNGTRGWLTTYGLDSTLPLTVGEWVYSPIKQYEATEIGAANAIYTLKAFIDNGIYRHSATSIYDQSLWLSGDWANVGFFSPEGVIRAKWNAFKAVDKLSGQRLKATLTDEPLVTAVASKKNNIISVVMANSSNLQAVTFELKNIASGAYTFRKYIIDGDMDEIHSNPCRYNKKTELALSDNDCGVDGAVDKAVAWTRNEAEKTTTAYMMSAGISQQNANNIFVCFNDPACNVVDYVKAFCQANPNQCLGKKAVFSEAQQLYNNLFYHGRHKIKSGKVYTISTFIDQINNLKEVSMEGSKQEKQVSVTGGTYSEVITMKPYSVILIELVQ